jgi:hypothetical protein
MVTREITITLPDELAEAAQQNGLLTPGAIEQLIRGELWRRKSDRLAEIMDRLAAADKGDLTEADITEEIAAYRTEKRAGREGRR